MNLFEFIQNNNSIAYKNEDVFVITDKENNPWFKAVSQSVASCNSSVYFTPVGNHLCICALVFAVSPCPKRGVLRRRLAYIRRRRGTGEVSLASATWRNYWPSICCCWLLPCSANRPSPARRAPGNTTAATGAGVPAAGPGRARSATVLHPGVAVVVLYWCDLYVMPRSAAHGA
ncbi:uncharacterized protein LOC126419393 [Schistocerca serialis cubense]|uniref:uncharacterized protein LOC126419393 n=1 Tax=Schistocerca serialis cubense TaxID=2023355 RepID=UPI00214E2344|nr:uncharacterized protein LOC126419393 [Schistocerca serialis cubense]